MNERVSGEESGYGRGMDNERERRMKLMWIKDRKMNVLKGKLAIRGKDKKGGVKDEERWAGKLNGWMDGWIDVGERHKHTDRGGEVDAS